MDVADFAREVEAVMGIETTNDAFSHPQTNPEVADAHAA